MGELVYLGMSGGVDSALSAALLLEAGYNVKAIYMRNWSKDLPGFKCPWADDLADAERVCVTLGIDLDVWDCEAEYKATVVDYLLDAYEHGRTPNPDVMCNQTVKFGTFAERAFAEGADFVATGHYAQNVPGSKNFCVPQMLTRIRPISYGVYQVICLNARFFLLDTLPPRQRYALCVRSEVWA